MALAAPMSVSLLGSLPAPVREYHRPVEEELPVSRTVALARTVKEPPPYGSQERRTFIPRKQVDFGDGGAFPEAQLAQYPLDMGRPDAAKAVSKTLAITVNSEGGINYDAILRQGRNKDKFIASTHGAMVPKLDKMTDEALAKPDEDEVEATRKATQAALDKLVAGKIIAAQPKTLPQQPGGPTFIKYTPSQQGAQYNSGARQRVIRMQDMQIDPMDPPKFRHKKVPRGTGSPPVPVMHSPPRSVSVQERADWKIPPCISNWKNQKGYTIPLDKRLAADGRGLQETAINDSFAKFTEALYVAEQSAREAVETRSKVQRELAAREKEKREAELRALAAQARQERTAPSLAARTGGSVAAGVAAMPGRGAVMDQDDQLPPPPPMPPPGGHQEGRERGERETREEYQERKRRDDIRGERKREREREFRMEAKDAHGVKKSKLTRDRERDISEKIALGQANVRSGGEALYDQRLFNQEGGIASNLAADDSYNVYDKALFAERGSQLYRPSRGGATADDDEGPAEADVRTGKFKPDKGFAGVDYSTAGERNGPVQFEADPAEADPFGLGSLVDDVNRDSRRKRDRHEGDTPRPNA